MISRILKPGETKSAMEAPSRLRLDIIVVGCGLGGLVSALCLVNGGHSVTVFEASSSVGEIGAGLQVSPNMSRLLRRWGLGNDLERLGVKPTAAVWRRYKDGDLVGRLNAAVIEEENDIPYYNMHRGDLYRAMLESLGTRANIRTSAMVVRVIPGGNKGDRPSVVLVNGEEITGDLIIGADGVKSVVRQCFLDRNACPSSGTVTSSAYRALLPRSKILENHILKDLDKSEVTCWMGPGKNVVGYWVRAKSEYNVVLASCISHNSSEETWSAPVDVQHVKDEYEGWEPRVQAIIDLIPSTLKWKLIDRPVLEHWVDSTGRIILLGDACHALLPHSGQGAAMAIEDAAVLGKLLSNITSQNQIDTLLLAYEQLRKGRCTEAYNASLRNGNTFHLQDGPGQVARDTVMRETLSANFKGNSWTERAKDPALFGYDAEKEAEKWLEENAEVLARAW